MVRWVIPFALLIGSVVLTSAVAADEADDVQAINQAWLSALNAQNVKAVLSYYHTEETSFGPFGNLLTEGDHTAELTTAHFEAGFKTALRWRHMKVKVFGESAIVTGYAAGTITLPGGKVVAGTWRTSVMWVQEEGKWQIVHVHGSSLLPD